MSELFYNADLTEVGRKKVQLNILIINIKTEVFLKKRNWNSKKSKKLIKIKLKFRI